jgi:hypothetical protein
MHYESNSDEKQIQVLIPISLFKNVRDSGQVCSFALSTETTPPGNALFIQPDDEGTDYPDNADFHFNGMVAWEEVVDLMATSSRTTYKDKESAVLYSPTLYQSRLWFRSPEKPCRGYRCEQNATTSALVVIDVDNKNGEDQFLLDRARARLVNEEVEAIICSTASNLHGEHFRILIPLAEPVDVQTHKRAVMSICHMLKPGWLPDTSKMNCYSLFYLPGIYPNAQNEFHHIRGTIRTANRWIDWYPKPHRDRAEQSATEHELNRDRTGGLPGQQWRSPQGPLFDDAQLGYERGQCRL